MDSNRMLAVVACALALDASQAFAAKYLKLPDVIGQRGPDAVKQVNNAGFKIVALIPVPENSLAAESKPGLVFKQDPASAAKLDASSEVKIYYYQHVPCGFKMPRFVGTSIDAACKELGAHGVEVTKKTDELKSVRIDDSDHPGHDREVTDQSPAPGTTVYPHSKFTLRWYHEVAPPIVKNSDGTVVMPNFVGATESNVKNLLHNLGFKNSVIKYHKVQNARLEADTVESTTPPAGTKLRLTDAVSVLIKTDSRNISR